MIVLATGLALAACDDPPSDTRAQPPPLWRKAPQCQLPVVSARVPLGLVPAAGGHRFNSPVDLVRSPLDAREFHVVEAGGRIVAVDREEGGEPRVVVELSDRLMPWAGEMGLWGLAFHPRYPDVPEAFVFYTGAGGSTGYRSVLSRLTSKDGGLTLDPTTEEILISLERVPGGFHMGGKIAFGTDGYLYVSTGDGNEYGDPKGYAQNLSSLFGKMLRIDVEQRPGYAIPPTNPFAAGGGAPEVYAWGFRNPWRWSFDRDTGELWLGDVGHDHIEEINRVEIGGNYGWNVREGTRCFSRTPCDDPSFIDPVAWYPHSEGRAMVGGYVYRGTELPELFGRYVFGDNTSGAISALFDDGIDRLMFSGRAISAFGEDADGELYVADLATNKVFRLARATGATEVAPSGMLSSTGCLDVSSMIPYEVNVPLWSDGLEKLRWMAIPEGKQIRVLENGALDLPNGTVLVKTFLWRGRKIETRLLVRDDQGTWLGFTYEWLPHQGEALLIGDAKTVDLDGLQWTLPSRSDCLGCHTAAAGGPLGLDTRQLDVGDQLDRLERLGLFDRPPPRLPPLPRLDSTAAPQRRARAYLHANCSMCHRPGGGAREGLDFRYDTPLKDMGICDQPSTHDFGEQVRLLKPGKHALSALYLRMSHDGELRMPPIGTRVVDRAATEVVASWIDGLWSCDGP